MADLIARRQDVDSAADRLGQRGRDLSLLTVAAPSTGDPIVDEAAGLCAGTILAAVDACGDELIARAGSARAAMSAYQRTDAALARHADAAVRGTRVRAE
ncbi:MAG TPA: hypothetical protein VFT67_16910 [Jatrophihabitantaceae bacterium]|nr:hypothetical protein [Jatrophihabitantaceae bacterium]